MRGTGGRRVVAVAAAAVGVAAAGVVVTVVGGPEWQGIGSGLTLAGAAVWVVGRALLRGRR